MAQLFDRQFLSANYQQASDLNARPTGEVKNEKIFCYLFFNTMGGIVLTIECKNDIIYCVYMRP